MRSSDKSGLQLHHARLRPSMELLAEKLRNYDWEVSMAAFFLWCILFILCWPLALVALVLYPIVWLLLLPFRIVGITVHGVLALITAIILLPARLLSAPFHVGRVA